MKNKKIGIILLIGLIVILVSQNIMLMNKTNKLLGTIPSRNIDSNEVEYTPKNKSVQGAINDLAEKANIIGTDEEKNKFRDDSKTLIGQIGTDKLNTTSQNLTGAINELSTPKTGYATCNSNVHCNSTQSISWARYGKIVIVSFTDIYPTVDTTKGRVTFATGLPKAASTIYGVATLSSASAVPSSISYRMVIEYNTGELKWHYTYNATAVASGQMIYITNEE